MKTHILYLFCFGVCTVVLVAVVPSARAAPPVCASGKGELAEGGCKCYSGWTCDHSSCEVSGERCAVPYVKVNSNYTAKHSCSENGVYSHYYGRCLCRFGYETTTVEGEFQCNVNSWDSGLATPWAASQLIDDRHRCDCSMRWVEYEHRTIVAVADKVARMWGVASEFLNATSLAHARRIAKQLCYLHFDCNAFTLEQSSLSTYSFTVKFWTQLAGGQVNPSYFIHSATSVSSRAFVLLRYAYAKCGNSRLVEGSYLYTQLASTPYKGTTGASEGLQTASLTEKFYDYLHQHPEYVTPNSGCERGQPAVGESCSVKLCPPFSSQVNLYRLNSSEPCARHGTCVSPARQLTLTSTSSKVRCSCSLGYEYRVVDPTTTDKFSSYGFCEQSNKGKCSSSSSGCTGNECCSGQDRGECVGEVDSETGEITVSCRCKQSGAWGGKYCETSLCNKLDPYNSCVAKNRGYCIQTSSPHYTNAVHDETTFQCMCKNGYMSSVRLLNHTSMSMLDVNEDEANCDKAISNADYRRYQCYNSPLASEPECGGQGMCVKIECSAFDTSDSCLTFPQACQWNFNTETCSAYQTGTVYSCLCNDHSYTSNPNWIHGTSPAIEHPNHCKISKCTGCKAGQGHCRVQGGSVTETECECLKDSSGYTMFDGTDCSVILFNTTTCTLSYNHAVTPPKATCVSCSLNTFGPYCNVSCPTPSLSENPGSSACDRHNCGPSRSLSCLQTGLPLAVVNQTHCGCTCFSPASTSQHGVLSQEGYCENPCETGVWKAVGYQGQEVEYGCKCEMEVGSPYAGLPNGYSGERCEIPKCKNGGSWDFHQSSGYCSCASGYTGATCTSCASGYHLDPDDGLCKLCPECQNGGTCVTSGSDAGTCSCPAAYIGDLCETFACENTTTGNCNGDWSLGCVGYDTNSKAGMCECQPWSYGSPHFGERNYGDCTSNLNATLCNSRGYTTVTNAHETNYVCHCDTGYTGNDCSLYSDDQSCSATEVWDSGSGQCVCKSSYFGTGCLETCEEKYCNNMTSVCVEVVHGSDPVTCACPSYVDVDGQQCAQTYRDYTCNGRGDKPDAESEYDTCDCDHGFLQPNCETTCRSGKCNGNGDCSDGHQTTTGDCVCDSGWTGSKCNLHECGGNGKAVGASKTCECNPGWTGTTCCTHVSSCNSRAVVVQSNGVCMCSCADGYEQPHCTDPTKGEAATNYDVLHSTSTTSSSSSSSDNTLIYAISGSVGGALLIGLIVFLVLYCKKKQAGQTAPPAAATSQQTAMQQPLLPPQPHPAPPATGTSGQLWGGSQQGRPSGVLGNLQTIKKRRSD